MPDMPKQATGFAPPSDIPAPEALDWAKPYKPLKNWFPPLRQVIFTPWIQTAPGEETFVSTIGMVPGKIYQIKHQILDGQKKLELKQKLNFQAEQLQTDLAVQPIFASEPKDRAYYFLADNVAGLDGLFVGQKSSQLKPESALMTSYGNCLVNLKSEQPGEAESYIKTRAKRLVNCNGQHLLTLDAGIVQQTESEKMLKPQQIAEQITRQMHQNPLTQPTVGGQVMQTCTTSGVPIRQISVQYLNTQLLQRHQQELKTSPESKFRPLNCIQTFQIAENNCLVVAALAEVMLKDYPAILELAREHKQKFDPAECSMLTTVIMKCNSLGDLLEAPFYVIDCPELQCLSSFEYLQIGKKSIFNSRLSQNGFMLVHSVASQLDCTSKDALCCLPRQSAVLRLQLAKGEENLYDSEVVFYSAQPQSKMATVVHQLVGRVIPLAVQRVSSRIYLLVNNLELNCVEVIVLSVPRYISQGCKDIKDVLAEEDDQISDYTAELARTGVSDTQENDEIRVKMRIVVAKGMAQGGTVLGLLKGGFVAGIKLGQEWKVIEVMYEQVMYAAVVQAANLSIIRVF